MSDEACLMFIHQHNIEIPSIYNSETEAIPFVRAIIEAAETNSEINYVCIEPELNVFASEIRMAVNAYNNQIATCGVENGITEDVLKDNDAFAEWSDDYVNYNCYGYAIEKDIWLIPGAAEWVDAGNSIKEFPYDDLTEIKDIANFVKEDLEYYGYSVQDPTLNMPNTAVNAHQHLICVRKNVDGRWYVDQYGNMYFMRDFHFMKLATDGYWYHKPGGTSPLKYLGEPSSDTIWVMEYYDGINYVRNDYYIYDSEIYFIEYTTPHEYKLSQYTYYRHKLECSICGDVKYEDCTYSYTSNEDGTHTRTCTDCGKSINLNCEMTYEYRMYEQHLGECGICGYTEVGSCTPEPTYTGNGSTNHIHQDACADCGNLMSDAQTACTFTYIFAGTIDGTNRHDCICTECGYRKIENGPCIYRASDYCYWCGTHRDAMQVASLEELYTIE